MPGHQVPLPLDYASPPPGKKPGRPVLLAIIVIIAAVGLFVLLGPNPGGSSGTSNRAKCASNMHQIGLAILLYQNDHAGAYPNALEELMEEQITTSVFICPSSHDTPSIAATTQQVGVDFRASGHLSYIYLGKGLTDKTVTADMVILYEPISDHGNGMNVLFGDGHVESVSVTGGKKIIAAAAGGNRVRMNTSSIAVSTGPIASTQPASQ